ncbi:MAG TPA: helix-turn-helix domain-containing protein [Chthoniobacterales bacterium]|nr:helix-turn-helix domain-containing protein [Chthoniobacterales bacterium]
MTIHPASSSAEISGRSISGRLIAQSSGQAWKDLLVQIYSAPPEQDTVIVPIAEPQIVRIISGSVVIEERDLGGRWLTTHAQAGDFFLTASQSPYELRWRAANGPHQTMHLYLGLPVLNRAIQEAFEKDPRTTRLRDLSGFKDVFLGGVLEGLRSEITSSRPASPLFVQGIAQSLAVHLVRNYAEQPLDVPEYKGGLPGFKLRKITELMASHLEEEFSLIRLAREADMSEFHFSRLFKRTTGYTPSQYFIRLRMERARRLLKETKKSIIEIGLEVGYTSPSHFAHVFRREVGILPSEYRSPAVILA